MQNIEDEFHFVMDCPNYKELRKSFFQELNHVSYFDNLPDNKCKFIVYRFCHFFGVNQKSLVQKLTEEMHFSQN